jgi:hypothetical protein
VAGLPGVVRNELTSHALQSDGPKADYRGGDLEVSAGASIIAVLRDDIQALVLHLQLDPGHQEGLAFNRQWSPRFCTKRET